MLFCATQSDSIQEPTAEAAGAASSSLSKPACLWLSSREIELAGGTVVRALTKVDTPAYADVQYHWKPGQKKREREINNTFV